MSVRKLYNRPRDGGTSWVTVSVGGLRFARTLLEMSVI